LSQINNPSGAEHLVDSLKAAGVEIIFCITGAGNLAIIDAILTDGSIKLIYSHHEQAAVMEAQGYSRISGKIGVALVTTGGGTSNAVTGILSAYLDSVPVLIISGNESSFHCSNVNNLRAYGVQGFDSVSVLKPITKSTIRIVDARDTKNITEKMISKALTARMGPTHIDFPMDLQRKQIASSEMVKTTKENSVDNKQTVEIEGFVKNVFDNLRQSKRPVLYIGNGCRNSKTKELIELVINKFNIPFFLSWSAIDLFPETHPMNMGRIGIYGDRAANIALQKSDFLICLGTRLAIPQIGYDAKDFGRNATKWIVEIDPTECQKFTDYDWNILNCDVLNFLSKLNEYTDKQSIKLNTEAWLADLNEIWSKLPRIEQIGPEVKDSKVNIHSAEVIQFLNDEIHEDAIVCTDVGAGLLTGHYMYESKGTQRFFTSQGLGEMGFGLPGAIGAHFAAPSKQLICLNTDGAIMFNMQELQLVVEHKIPLKLFVFNNDGYAMIKISQHNLFNSRITGSSIESGISFPSFENLAMTFNFNYMKISNLDSLNDDFRQQLNDNNPVLFEIMMDSNQKYFPRLATAKLGDGAFISPPIEDLDPLISISLLENLLSESSHPNSKRAREK
jgi:acetolactate synthase-1/2/3 large subunit